MAKIDVKNLIDRALEKLLVEEDSRPLPYNTIEEYEEYTKRRFRRTKEDIQEGLSREKAFEKHLDKLR